jgi:hypothetical protein
MATKKKSKKQTKLKKTVGKKPTSKKKAVQTKLAKKTVVPLKKIAPKKAAPKKAAVIAKPIAKKTPVRKPLAAPKKKIRGKSQDVDTVDFTPAGTGARSGGQSGSLQGLSDVESADSESVDELIEEGNAFEAEVVKGVEDAPDPDQGEVRTHEVPEDDVPGEYDDQ